MRVGGDPRIDHARTLQEITMFGKTFSSAHFAAGRTGLRRVAGDLLTQVERFVRAVRNRRDVMRLAELDDRTLKDIGLVRSDVAGALDQPLSADPSRILSLRRLERSERRVRSRPVLVAAPSVTPRIRAR
jgi:uncharacterized protein YjiS (DUF1127 family)